MNESEAKVRFVQGPYTKYNVADYEDAVYFATDTKQLLLNGQQYGSNNTLSFDGIGSATQYFLMYADNIISGVYPNICTVKTNEGNGIGYATATYIDAKNFRVDYYAPLVKIAGITENAFELYRKYIVYKDGQPTTDDYAYDYDIMPANCCPVDASSHTPGYKELFFSGKDGELKMHFWNGTGFTHVLLPTSKDVASTYTTKYVLDFQPSPSLKFSSNTKYDSNTGTTMYQMILGGGTTNVYCDNNWIIRGGKLISYSDGTRSMCLRNESGGNLSVGDRVCIECDGDCVDIDLTSSCFSYSVLKGDDTTTVHILTVTSNPNGDAFIAIKRYMYITRIGYLTQGNTKTFTVSTPSGVKEISVLSNPENAVTKDDVSVETTDNINTWINNAF